MNIRASWAVWLGVLNGCQTAPVASPAAAPVVTSSAAPTQPRVGGSAQPVGSAPKAPPLASAAIPPRAATPAVGPRHAPKPLAPVGPYPAFSEPIPNCASPLVLAASAPAKTKQRSEWFWPWVVQALLAHDHVFQLTAELNAPEATERAVQLVELDGPKNLSLAVRCKNSETCVDVVRVLRAVIPNSSARLACELSGQTTGRQLDLSKAALLPIDDRAHSKLDVGSACTRLAACARHEDQQADPQLGLKCQAAPSKFPIACAAQLTCYDVAGCAQLTQSSAPIFSPFSDLSEQIDARGVRIGRGLSVLDGGGGGGLEANGMSVWLDGIVDPRYGQWAVLLLSFEVSAQDPAEKWYGAGSAAWAVAVIQPNGVTLLGPRQTTVATTYNALNFPGCNFLRPDSFDYDGDGSAELLFPVSSSEHANSGTRAFQVWTIHNGQLRRYPGTEALLPIVGIEDVDSDGRPDLVLDQDNSLDDRGLHSSVSLHSTSLAHSLRNGGFSTTDSVARAH